MLRWYANSGFAVKQEKGSTNAILSCLLSFWPEREAVLNLMLTAKRSSASISTGVAHYSISEASEAWHISSVLTLTSR
jgi:hypothetical protein